MCIVLGSIAEQSDLRDSVGLSWTQRGLLFDSYLEKEIVRPLMKRIEQNRLRGEDVIDALRKIVQDVPLAFDCTSSGELSDRMNLFPNH